jgi:hypothetical protein
VVCIYWIVHYVGIGGGDCYAKLTEPLMAGAFMALCVLPFVKIYPSFLVRFRPRRSEVLVVLSPMVSVCVVHRASLGESEPLLYTAPRTFYTPVSGRHLHQAPSARVVPCSRPISCLLSPSHSLLPSLYTPTFIRPSLFFYPTPPSPLNFDCYTFYSLPLPHLIISEQAQPRKCHRRTDDTDRPELTSSPETLETDSLPTVSR